jgi:hypothetical protein
MGIFLIAWDGSNNYSTRLKAVICSLLMTSANSSKNAGLALGNLRFYPLNYGNKFRARISDADLNARVQSSKSRLHDLHH